MYYWVKKCYQENQFQLWVLNCLDEYQFNNLITKIQTQQSKIESQEKIINQIIAKNAKWSFFYAEYVLHGPFPAGEPTIATYAGWSYLYARDVLYKPFSAGEPAIKKNPHWKQMYENQFNVKL